MWWCGAVPQSVCVDGPTASSTLVMRRLIKPFLKCCILSVQENDNDQLQSQRSFVVVVAIDFGTTSSGYAYAFSKEPECIHTMR